MDALSATLEKKAKEYAERDGLSVTFAYRDVFPESVNSGEAVAKIRRACRRFGYP